MTTGTIQQLAVLMGLDYPTTNHVIKMLVAKGVAKSAGQRPNLNGKGKPAGLYSVPVGTFSLCLIETGAAA